MLCFGLCDGNPKFDKSPMIWPGGGEGGGSSRKKIFSVQMTKLDHLEKN